MTAPNRQTPSSDVTAELVQLLPELAVTLFEAGPHKEARSQARGEPLTGRQMRAVVFLAHRDSPAMGELADGLDISRAAASELVTRLIEKGVVTRMHDPADRRVVSVCLSPHAERLAADVFAQWSAQIAAAFALHPDLDPDTLVAFLRTLIAHMKGRSGP